MKKGEKKKQQKALKHRTEHKQVQKQVQAPGGDSPQRHVRQARSYPIADCWVQRGWEQSRLAVVVVTRQQPNGQLAFGSYLVDVYCLGVKDALCNADIPPGEFQREFLPQIYRAAGQPLKISPDLAHEIIYGSIDYARQFGFRPHRDFAQAQLILDRADVHPLTGQVQFGKNGKPFFVAGPYDNVEAVLRQLRRTAGEGNYDYLLPIDDPFDEDDEWDDAEAAEVSSPLDLLDEAEFDLGAAVVVKAGTKDPDTGYDLGGWQGRITDIIEEDDEEPLATIEWDSQTLNNTPAWIFEQCVKEELNWAVINLSLDDLERTAPRDTPADVSTARAQLNQQYGTAF